MNRLFSALLLLALLPTSGFAAELIILLKDDKGMPVSDAVVSVSRINGQAPAFSPMQVVVDQIDEMFVPHVRAATTGSAVSFPNSDHVRHHVYSFSDPLTFELPLYIGIPAEPVVFDKPGIVTLGCNIHDHMLGYILIVETPYFTEISEGEGVLTDLPAGTLEIDIWHPLLNEGDNTQHQLTLSEGGTATLEVTLALKPAPMLRRAPRRNSTRY